MTEAEWLSSTDPVQLLRTLTPRRTPSERKVRLFNAAICRRFWHYLPTESQLLLEESERVADGLVVVTEPYDLCHRANNAVAPFDRQYPDKRFPNRDVRIRRDSAAAVCYGVIPGELWGAFGYFVDLDPDEKPHQSAIIRDIFGNPFRPVAFDPAWRTDSVAVVARGIYESRDFTVLPLLAEALREAGCDDADILAHCRDAGPHARGCWVIDLAMGKA